MDRPDWDELVAQVEELGCGALEFYLGGADVDGGDMQLTVTSIKTDDEEIKVVLE